MDQKHIKGNKPKNSVCEPRGFFELGITMQLCKVSYCYFIVLYIYSIQSIKPNQQQHSNIREDLVPK